LNFDQQDHFGTKRGIWFGQYRRSMGGILCFRPLELYACKFGCSIKTYKISTI